MTLPPLHDIVATERHPLPDDAYRAECRDILRDSGALVPRGFLRPQAVASICREGEDHEHLAFYSTETHNVYLTPPDADYPDHHPRNQTERRCAPPLIKSDRASAVALGSIESLPTPLTRSGTSPRLVGPRA
ncbi:MAG: hypothetical protein AAF628_21365 [Planctomycetota bacterium]